MRRKIILVMMIAIMTIGYAVCLGQSDSTQAQKTDTIIVHDVDTVETSDTVYVALTSNDAMYVEKALDLMESNKVWINIMLTAVGILVAVISLAAVFAVYQGNKARSEARVEMKEVRRLRQRMEEHVGKAGSITEQLQNHLEVFEQKAEIETDETTDFKKKLDNIPKDDAIEAVSYYEALLGWMKIQNIDLSKIPADTHKLIARHYFRLEQFNKAKDGMLACLKVKPDDEEANFMLGNITYGEKNFKSSMGYFEKVTKINLDNDAAYYNWGLSLFEIGESKNKIEYFHTAIEKFKKAIKIAPKKDDAFMDWGTALCQIGEITNSSTYFQDGIDKYSEAVEINPKNDKAIMNWGVALFSIAKAENKPEYFHHAIEKYRTAVEVNPERDAIYNNWGVTLAEIGKLKNKAEYFHKAIDKFKICIEIKPNNDKAIFNMACTFAHLNDKIKMLINLDKAIQLNSKYKFVARKDKDLKAYLDDPDFLKLTEPDDEDDKEKGEKGEDEDDLE